MSYPLQDSIIPVTHGFFGKQGGYGAPLLLKQVHSNLCLYIEKPFADENRPEADAMVTDQPEIAIGIITADCAPVLFYGEKENGAAVIGAAHAGWKGALSGILENTVMMMADHGAVPETWRAVIGPCIAQDSYEVSDDFLLPFLTQDKGNDRFFRDEGKSGHKMFDLPAYVRDRLHKAGVPVINSFQVDTYSNEQDFYSYRRAAHKGTANDGRQISVIRI